MIWTTSFLSLVLTAAQPPNPYFAIHVVDEATGRGVPLVELRTVNDIRYYTDSAGIVAFHEPGLSNREVFFHVKSHGYEYRKDGFGYRGKRLKIIPGGKAVLKIKRRNIAERLYRVTGAGIYRDSHLVGAKVPLRQPLLNAQVFGSDSVVNTVYRGKIYWFWGDTNKPSYPLGNFFVPGATSELPDKGGLDPEVGVDLHYFAGKDGFAHPTAKMPGPGPCWIGGLVAVKDKSGRERLFAQYARVKKTMKAYQRGLLEFNDKKNVFEKKLQLDLQEPLYPYGHAFHHTDKGVAYVYFGNPFPHLRVRATAENVLDVKKYQTWTCFKEGSTTKNLNIDRAADGRSRFAWRTGVPPLTPQLQTKLVQAGKIKKSERLYYVQDIATKKPIRIHSGSVAWNAYRKCWVMIGLEVFGSSFLGEVWYAEAKSLEGPWSFARKIVTHDTYSFYNPKQHPMFAKGNGRYIFFEGTYATTFSGNKHATPWYDYNQIMYKLDLADKRLHLPMP